jgi:hypothetical protein
MHISVTDVDYTWAAVNGNKDRYLPSATSRPSPMQIQIHREQTTRHSERKIGPPVIRSTGVFQMFYRKFIMADVLRNS